MHSAIFSCDPIFADEAVKEFQTHVGGKIKHLDDSTFHVQTREDFAHIAAQFRQSPPIFIRHICPVQTVIALEGDEADISRLSRAVRDEIADEIVTSMSFSVQARILPEKSAYKPFEINKKLAATVQAQSGAQLDVREPQQVVSVIVGKQDGVLAGFLGVSDPQDNMSDWAGGHIRFKREKEQLSRAEFKLLEAFNVFKLDVPDSGLALDLGAAPGGWTRVLRQRGMRVVAVDPADLHPSLDSDEDVIHIQDSSQNFLKTNEYAFDLIVNDMRLDARKSAQIMVSCAPTLGKGGYGIITLKLPQSTPYKMMSHSLNILREAYSIENVRNLFHNRHEVTVILKGKVKREKQKVEMVEVEVVEEEISEQEIPEQETSELE